MKDPDPYLNDLGIALSDVVDPTQPALIDPDHRISVNWETYYVSSDANRERFLQSPWKYAGEVTDPVTHERFTLTAASPSRSVEGKRFYFSNEETAARFDKDPTMYAEPMIGMAENH